MSSTSGTLPFDDTGLRDQPSRDRIVSGLDRNVLVEAGAGSGKTHEMARRMAAGVASGAYVVHGMAAVTFTRKAAAELRGRFQRALEDRVAGRGGRALNELEEERVRAALSNLERFFAGTIHSFCAHLLRERPVEAGVSPGFTELDEVDDAILRRQSWRDFVSQQLAAGHPLMLELREAGVKPADLDEAFGTVTLYEEVDFPPGAGQKPEADAPWAALDAFWTALKRKLPVAIDPETSCPTQKAARKCAGQMRVANTAGGHHRALADLLDTWKFEPGITQNRWSGDPAARRRMRDEIVALHQPFRDGVVLPFLARWRQYLYRLGVTLLIDARGFAARERRRLNVLNYGDLLQLAVRVLRQDAGVRRALQQKYRWLFVDEFQDTDPVQAEIIFLLASDPARPAVGAGSSRPGEAAGIASRPPDGDWRTLPLRPGALFVVGDPKQSIYRFRRADIDIYNIVRARLDNPPAGGVLPLTTNFRSIPALCGWANTAFVTQFPAEATAQSPRFAALDAAPAKAAGNAHPHCGVFTLTVPGTCDRGDVGPREAERIARYIRSDVTAGRRAFGDFLVLTRRKKSLSLYADALEQLQVPIEVSGAGAFRESIEVAQLALLLRALSDPQDAVSLVGVLRGPLFGISDVELFAYRQAGGWFSLFSRDEAEGGGRETPVPVALGALSQYYRWSRVLPAAPALERILEHSGYLALAATSPGGVEAGDLLHAIDRVRQVVGDGLTLADAARALEEDLEASSEVESLPLEPGRTDVVRLMNLHKAKGLEAPVVFLADPCGGFDPRVDVRIIREGATARGYFQIKCRFGKTKKLMGEPDGWASHEADEKAYLEAEETRLLYVAATRARETLVIGRWDKSGASSNSAWGGLGPYLQGAGELPVPDDVAVPPPKRVDLSPKARAAADAVRRHAHHRARTPPWSVTSVSAEARHIAKMARAAELAAPDDPTRVVVRDTPSHRADAGIAWGTLIHGLLEHAMRHQDATRDDLRRLAQWLTVEAPQLRPVIDDAIDTVQAVTRAEFWQQAKGTERSEETPFAFVTQPGVGMTGIIDLMFRTADGWQVVDYKTDIATGGELAEKYAAQLETYRRALESCGLVDVRASLVPVRLPKADA
jgi:ATP-dependent helicase/nuclease subunit A